MKKILVGLTAIAASLGWLQLAPSFGFPVTAPAAMLDRMLGAHREAGPAGWALLLLGELALTAGYLLLVQVRAQREVVPFAFAIGYWLVTGAVLMPLIGLIQGAQLAFEPAAMHANFFMLNLGPGAAAEALIGWLLFGAVLAGGRNLEVSPRVFGLAVSAAVLAAAIALAVPSFVARTGGNSVVEGRVPSLPKPAFVSVLEL